MGKRERERKYSSVRIFTWNMDLQIKLNQCSSELCVFEIIVPMSVDVAISVHGWKIS